MSACRFLEPMDVLFLRGNRLFGGPGSHSESLVPPWPSVAAGALRAQMLAHEGIDTAAFARGQIDHPSLGTPRRPGAFRLTGLYLARRSVAGVETLHPWPADLVAEPAADGAPLVRRLYPSAPAPGLLSSAALTHWPALRGGARVKPLAGLWLTRAGWETYLQGRTPEAGQVESSAALWKTDLRVGVGLDPGRRAAADGQLFSSEALALEPGLGFLVLVEGAEPPRSGTLRLGGDGRGAAVSTVAYEPPEPDYLALAAEGRCRLVLTSPGLFEASPDQAPYLGGGWLPRGLSRGADGGLRLALPGLDARLICAAVPRGQTVSGWDLAGGRPKAAQRAVPAGSVYWLEDLSTTPEALRKLASDGLWPESGYDAQRRAEGFNRCALAPY